MVIHLWQPQIKQGVGYSIMSASSRLSLFGNQAGFKHSGDVRGYLSGFLPCYIADIRQFEPFRFARQGTHDSLLLGKKFVKYVLI